jgi:hypothetical protein
LKEIRISHGISRKEEQANAEANAEELATE